MKKTNAVAYYSYKIQTTSRTLLINEINEAPLKIKEKTFILDIVDGLSYRELAQKWQISKSRVSKWKRTLFEKLHQADMRKIIPKTL